MKQILRRLLGKPRDYSFYSQYGQDKWLFENIFSKRNGVFVEVGADDGIDKSNTYFFERERGWGGLCIEPSPRRFKLLRQNRQCFCEETAIAKNHGSVEFMDISGWGKGLSGIVNNYDERHVTRIDREMQHPNNRGHELVQVSTTPLKDLLSKHQIHQVDFCTIDTEGSELEVVESIDFTACQFDVFLIENNYQDSQVAAYLDRHGFQLQTRVGIDDVFIRKGFKSFSSAKK